MLASVVGAVSERHVVILGIWKTKLRTPFRIPGSNLKMIVRAGFSPRRDVPLAIYSTILRGTLTLWSLYHHRERTRVCYSRLSIESRKESREVVYSSTALQYVFTFDTKSLDPTKASCLRLLLDRSPRRFIRCDRRKKNKPKERDTSNESDSPVLRDQSERDKMCRCPQ